QRNRVPAVASGTPRCASCHQSLPWLASAGDEDFAEVARDAPVPVLIDLWAPWCAPCRQVSPVVESMARTFTGRMKVVKVNADEAPRTSSAFAVSAIPTLLLLRDGAEVSRRVGALPPAAMQAWLSAELSAPGSPGAG
ncbi:MAG: thioredoxin, partial [Actinomycetes bacterium]